jgi:hypothetical protein
VNIAPPAVSIGVLPGKGHRAKSGALSAGAALQTFTLTQTQVVTLHLAAGSAVSTTLMDESLNTVITRGPVKSFTVTLTLEAGTYFMQFNAAKAAKYSLALTTKLPKPVLASRPRTRP